MTGEQSGAIEALLPAYALNALDDEDRELVEKALEHEPRYREELKEYLATVAQLAGMHQPLAPSSALRERVLRSRPAEDSAPFILDLPVVRRPRRRRWVSVSALSAAAALVIALVSLGGFSLWQQQQLHRMQGELEALSAEAAENESRLRAQQALTYWTAHPEVTTVAMRPTASPVSTLGSTSRQPPEKGLVIRSPEGETVLVVMNMPPLPEYYSYQAWLWDSFGGTHSLGVFEVDASGYAQILVDYPANARSPHYVGVSVEPVGGSVSPSSRSVLTSSSFLR